MCLPSLYSILQKLVGPKWQKSLLVWIQRKQEFLVTSQLIYLRHPLIFIIKCFKKYGIRKFYGNFPQNLKLTDITPVYKKKDPTLVENYRSVSVLPTVSKAFERIIQKQVSTHIERSLSPYFCGSRKGFSTQFVLISFIEK